ncbi:hypothetical protein SAMN05421878_10413 [Actinobaculum suis]|uniref:Uncharacterized protein n=1 Tax=Actinobaculum suis TaxID=1657 RepID=A0A1G7B4Y6_9ACTO|nr:hypothetical protein SAMN05421878_10413 [Actinobaculum suis]
MRVFRKKHGHIYRKLWANLPRCELRKISITEIGGNNILTRTIVMVEQVLITERSFW